MTDTEKLLAIEEIKALRARFARCMDTKQWPQMQETISDDCRFDCTQEGGVEELWIGAEDIVANIRRNLDSAVSVHHAHTPEIEITSPTTARGVWAMHDLLRFPGAPTTELVGSGHYHETYEKKDGRWQLKTYKLTRLRVDIAYVHAGEPPAAPPPRATRADRTIRAARLAGYGGPGQFRVEAVAEPVPGAGEILVRVAAAAVNPVDAKLRNGALSMFMPLQFPAQIGGDLAGTVEAVGPGVTDLKPGDRVMGMINPMADGAYAEKVAAPAAMFAKVPDGLDLVQAAALPMGVLTGVQLVEKGLQPKAGQRILVTGAAGSVGRAAVYAALEAGAQVVAGVRAKAFDAVADLPVAAVVDLSDLTAVEAAGPYDGIADTVGGRVAERLSRFVRDGGTLASAATPAPLPPVGSTVKSAPVWVSFDGPRLARFAARVAQKEAAMPIARTIALADIAEAHRRFDAGGLYGKIVVTM